MATDVGTTAVAAEALRLLSRSGDPLALTAGLHELLHRTSGAHVSVVLHPVSAGAFRVTSAAGLAASPLEAWLTSREGAEAADRAVAADRPVLISSLQAEVPELARRLGAGVAVLAPLALGDAAPGLLVAGFATDAPSPDPMALLVIAEAFALSIDRARAAQESSLERDLRGLAPHAVAEAYPAIGPALEGFCRSLSWLFGADRVELWQHDRSARELALAASSDGRPAGERVAAADEESLAARGLRLEAAELFVGSSVESPSSIAAPLRGRRRALGTLVLSGIHFEAGTSDDLLDRVNQVTQKLAVSLENAELLDTVVKSRHELRELAERLARTEKMLALGHFVAGIAHELNNPLQGALGHLELVRASGQIPPVLSRDITLIHRETDRAARIVTNLLLFAGSGRVRGRRVLANTIVARVLRLRARALKAAGIALERVLAEPSPILDAAPLLLQQAVLNIVVNAEQAMAGGGRLSVKTAWEPLEGRARIEVADTGPGLTDEVRARLFEPFFTTKDVGQGTGMGLALTFGIVRAHQGTLEAENRDTGGARFVISLPAQGPHAKMKRPAPP